LALALNVPGAHGVCAVDPVEHAEPRGQSVHSAAALRPGVLECVPARHGSAAAAPSAQKLPAVHGLHAVAPASSWYVPPGQSVHVSALAAALNVPGAHGVCAVEPVEHAEPLGQSVQPLDVPSPVELEYVPARHGSAAAAPCLQ